MDEELHSLTRRLIELRIEHADLDSLIDRSVDMGAVDDHAVQRRVPEGEARDIGARKVGAAHAQQQVARRVFGLQFHEHRQRRG